MRCQCEYTQIITWVFFDWGRCPHSGVHHGVLARKCYVADGPKGNREIDWMIQTSLASFWQSFCLLLAYMVYPWLAPSQDQVQDLSKTYHARKAFWTLSCAGATVSCWFRAIIFQALQLSESVREYVWFVFGLFCMQPRKAQLCGLEMETSYVWILVLILRDIRRLWSTDSSEVVRLCSRNDVGSSKDHTSVFRNLATDPRAHLALRLSLCHCRFGMPSTA